MSLGPTQVLTRSSARPERPPLELIRSTFLERLREGALELPLLPQVANQVVAMSNDPRADAARLSALIHRDPALAGHVLRIANSAAYLPRTPIVSLQQALTRLGFGVLSEIAMAASLQSGIFRVPGYESDLRFVWRHSLASGAYAKEIARIRRLNVETAFLCGLLHWIGKPVVLQAAANLARRLGVRLDTQSVVSLMDELHTSVGCLIAEKWGLPKQVRESIAYFSSYRESSPSGQEPMITCLADRLATHILCPDAFEGETVRDHPVFSDLNLYPEDVDTLLAKREDVLKIVESMAI